MVEKERQNMKGETIFKWFMQKNGKRVADSKDAWIFIA